MGVGAGAGSIVGGGRGVLAAASVGVAGTKVAEGAGASGGCGFGVQAASRPAIMKPIAGRAAQDRRVNMREKVFISISCAHDCLHFYELSAAGANSGANPSRRSIQARKMLT